MTRIPVFLPNDDELRRSKIAGMDYFYKLPRIVETFLVRANQELPKGYHAHPWTLNRSVSIRHHDRSIATISYDAIEHGIVWCLDHAKELALADEGARRPPVQTMYKDHEIARVVSALTETARTYARTQQLRGRISEDVHKFLSGGFK